MTGPTSGPVFLFPGQGAQAVGMGQALAQEYPPSAEIFQRADQILGFSISRLCFQGPAEELVKTENTQPALFTTCLAALAALTARGVEPAAAAGHSVGEYAALVAVGSIEFEAALPVVRRRGELMAAAVESTPGTMAAVMGLDADAVAAICRQASDRGVVEPSNINAPNQIVISGQVEAVVRAMELASEVGGRAVRLNVSAPFHSSLMAPVRDQLAPHVERLPISDPRVPVVANATGGYVQSASDVRRALLDQIAAPVRWSASMRTLLQAGFADFVEVGPGRVLAGLMRGLDRSVPVRPAGEPEDVEAVAS